MTTTNDAAALGPGEEGPTFREPWEAQAFALAVSLAEAGCFTWPEWTEVLSHEIRAAQERGDRDSGHTYYQHWLSALERICAEKRLAGYEALRARQQEWRRAYLNTPHGHAVELSAALKDPRQEN